ncbi:MAG: DUF3108 domain-containing protein [Betaproteobacteria bacterium]|nr:MAG: DUF3108 domain-containing protein [Betaproteobacteria bacterium]
MVRGLTRWPRRLAALALLLAVIAIHGCVTSRIAELIADFSAEAAMPPRIEVTYVREMEMAAPPAAAPRRVKPAQRARVRPRAGEATVAATEPAASVPADDGAPQSLPAEPTQVNEPVVASAPADSAIAPAAPASAASAPSTFSWPGPTRLSYVLTGNYQGEIHGSAQVEWIRVGERYQVHLDVTVGLPFAPLLSRRMSSEGQLTADGLMPERYDENSKVAFRERRRATLRFEPDAIVMPNGERRERWPGVQDTASQFVQLTYLFTTRPERLTPGSTIDVPLALPRNVSHWIYDVRDLDTLYTPFGHVEAYPLKPRRVARRGGDLSVEMWFAPSLHYLPVRLRIEQDAETYIDLMIARKPELAN